MKKIIFACLFLNTLIFTNAKAENKINIAAFFLANEDQPTEWGMFSESPCRKYDQKGKLFIFDPKLHKWFACEDGKQLNTGPASGGKEVKCRDIGRHCRTPTGRFRVIRKEDFGYVSNIYPLATEDSDAGGAPMHYAMFFDDSGYAIHASNAVSGKSNDSHGCIRVKLEHAEWLHTHFIEKGTPVLILPYRNSKEE